MEKIERDIVIIGSGPAGTAAARTFIDQSISVTLLEAGEKVERPEFPASDWMSFRRRQTRQHEAYYGESIPAASQTSTRSPKFSVEWFAELAERSADLLAFQETGFSGVPIAAHGGLSAAWGAGVSLFSEQDLAEWPIALDDLLPHYRSVAARIGLSGQWPEGVRPPEANLYAHPGVHPTAKRLLNASNKRGGQGMKIATALQAVVPATTGGRRGCDLSGFCLHGCPRKAIWSAEFELEALLLSRRLDLHSGTFVTEISRAPDGRWLISTRTAGGGRTEFLARRVFSAAGAIGSARIIDQALGLGARRRLLSTPTAAFAAVVPAYLGRGWSEKVYGLAQVSFEIALSQGNGDIFGYLFSAERISTSAMESASPLGFRGTGEVFRELAPATLLGNVFFDGRHSDHWVETRQGVVHVTGGAAASLAVAHAQTGPALRREFGKLGALVVPFRPALSSPGSDLHFAGTVPMKKSPQIGQCGPDGRVAGADNLFVVDGAALPTLPPKSHTFTIMANAERIAAGSL